MENSLSNFGTAMGKWQDEQQRTRALVEAMVNYISTVSHYDSYMMGESTLKAENAPSLSPSSSLASIAPPAQLIVLAGDEVSECATSIRESQAKMIKLLGIMTDIQCSLEGAPVTNTMGIDSSLVARVVEQLQQEMALEMTVFERLISLEGADQPNESEIITLTSCFSYMPYIDVSAVASINALCAKIK